MKYFVTVRSLLFFGLLIQINARATTLDVDVSQSSSTKSLSVTGSGDFDENVNRKLENAYTWNISSSPSVTESTDTSGAVIQDNTREFSGGFGLSTPSHFNFEFALTTSATPEENLSSVGPSLTMGYQHRFGEVVKAKSEHSEADSSEPHSPKAAVDKHGTLVSVDVTFAGETYEQKFSSATRRRLGVIARPTKGSVTISQNSTELALKIVPTSWFKVKASATKYTYDKDVNAFLQYLDNHQVLAQAVSGMSGALAGFYESSSSLILYFYFLDSWEIDLKGATYKIISDGSTVNSGKITLAYDINDDWHTYVAGESSKSSLATANTESTGSIGLSYDF